MMEYLTVVATGLICASGVVFVVTVLKELRRYIRIGRQNRALISLLRRIQVLLGEYQRRGYANRRLTRPQLSHMASIIRLIEQELSDTKGE